MSAPNSPTRSTTTDAGASIEILEGSAIVYFAFDVGHGVDLDLAERLFSHESQRESIRHLRRSASYLQFSPKPLRIEQAAEPLAIGGVHAEARAEVTLYDFGAVSVARFLPLPGDLGSVAALSAALFENPALLADARAHVEALLRRLEPAVLRASLSALVEDYTVFHVKRWRTGADVPEGGAAAAPDAFAGASALLARILRGESDALSPTEAAHALAARHSYGARDAAFVDYNGAIVFDETADDTLAVLEFVNVELLEVRFLDDRLDDALSHAADALARRFGRWPGFFAAGAADRRRIAVLQMDAALLFEGVNNALKLIGDQSLARLYRGAGDRFHLPDWDASILRKLQTLDGIHAKMSDEASARRMEALEWIIILLIAFSIVLPFVS